MQATVGSLGWFHAYTAAARDRVRRTPGEALRARSTSLDGQVAKRLTSGALGGARRPADPRRFG